MRWSLIFVAILLAACQGIQPSDMTDKTGDNTAVSHPPSVQSDPQTAVLAQGAAPSRSNLEPMPIGQELPIERVEAPVELAAIPVNQLSFAEEAGERSLASPLASIRTTNEAQRETSHRKPTVPSIIPQLIKELKVGTAKETVLNNFSKSDQGQWYLRPYGDLRSGDSQISVYVTQWFSPSGHNDNESPPVYRLVFYNGALLRYEIFQ